MWDYTLPNRRSFETFFFPFELRGGRGRGGIFLPDLPKSATDGSYGHVKVSHPSS